MRTCFAKKKVADVGIIYSQLGVTPCLKLCGTHTHTHTLLRTQASSGGANIASVPPLPCLNGALFIYIEVNKLLDGAARRRVGRREAPWGPGKRHLVTAPLHLRPRRSVLPPSIGRPTATAGWGGTWNGRPCRAEATVTVMRGG